MFNDKKEELVKSYLWTNNLIPVLPSYDTTINAFSN